ncbi:HK97-gp10 family putative phage morphogenesis protein [Streptococcus suis]|uniref:HK97-gp10 family putative phage morphogenesis protein n=1 Tax=Streptococcus suis TaxID=1307 RepID=UPI00211BB11B|nr:HK97-gp10 family putative phage morphogenesis protein [Streptococcus suis]MCQ9227114.1 HK97 gp10 family phage protein [Streptococcus suis]MCQ9229391.1 HK97 gp10 family phage protein [Streptococcus suis]MCQ9243270.1 HK97 gp10 family phage protein [Streptococcus suis]MCQ9275678.1 HK97 gp10 family phage protein [Streptococcus suis]MDE7535821.1 HK97 gp10 family phage protein [Streptococcus suis]
MSRLIGADKLIAKFRRLSGQQQTEIMAKAVHNAAKNVVQADAILRAPANNGDLRAGIKVRMSKSGNPRAEVVSASDHGGFVELGTGPKGAANHAGISPNVSVSYRSTPWYVHESQIDVGPYHFQKIGEFYKMFGQVAQPYLYPALKDNEERVTKSINRYVKRKLVEEVSK